MAAMTIASPLPEMIPAPLTSAEALEAHVPGEMIACSRGRAWKDLLVQIFFRRRDQESILLPAVPEPFIVWILSGAARVEERELGGDWQAHDVTAGDFYLTTSPRPCELRWRATGAEPFQVMHLYLGLPIVRRAIKDVLGEDAASSGLRDVSGARDPFLSALLGELRGELLARRQPSAMFVQGLAQSLAVHLIRHYSDPDAKRHMVRGGLPAFKLQKVMALLEARLDQPFSLSRLAREAGLSEFHFCRAFKASTGYAPSRYFIRLRIEKARRLLRETAMSVIEIGQEVGYSSPSHFAQVFRREAGVAPTEYRGRD